MVVIASCSTCRPEVRFARWSPMVGPARKSGSGGTVRSPDARRLTARPRSRSARPDRPASSPTRPRGPTHVWPLLRTAALLLLAVVALLLVGAGAWALEAATAALDRVGLATPTLAPPQLEGIPVAVAALAGLLLGRVRAVAHAVTFLHEFAHVLAATACGARPTGVVLHRAGGGHATYRSPVRGRLTGRLAEAATAGIGYPAPAAFAAAGAALLALAGPRPVLWALVALAVVVTLLSRSLWAGAVSVGLGGAAAAALSTRLEPYAAAIVVALTIAVSTRNLTDDVRRLRTRPTAGHDARKVQAAIGVPARVVQLLQAMATLAATALVAWHLTALTG